MPSKNTIRNFDVNSMYHVYNRGNNKRDIFLDDKDYVVFLSYLKFALLTDRESNELPKIDTQLISSAARFNMRRLGLQGKLELVSYCLMPNHFHLQFFQYDINAIEKLMRSVMTGYVAYFNKRHDCSGGLFQGTYKASHINTEGYWQHISRYIHLNPIDLGVNFNNYKYSSYKYYSGEAKAEWMQPSKGMSDMNSKEYKDFLDSWLDKRKDMKFLKEILADQ